MEELDEEAIDSVLRNVGYGFLGLAQDDRPYVIPMSFGYDGEALYFQMSSKGRKVDYLNSDAPATFNVLMIDEATGVSRSVLAEGALEAVSDDESEHAYETLATNANFGTDLTLWGAPLEETAPSLFVLRPEEVAGRIFGNEHRTASLEE